MVDTTSLSLLHQVRSTDDQAAWSRFFDLYVPFISHWGRRAGLSEADAADLSQDVLILLLAELPRFEYSPDRGRFRGWLRTVTVNRCRDRQRLKAIPTVNVDSQISQFEDSKAGNQFWEIEYRQHLVSRALQLMKSDFETRVWQAAWKQIVDERPATEVAAELGISQASAWQARSRVLRRLREELQDLLD